MRAVGFLATLTSVLPCVAGQRDPPPTSQPAARILLRTATGEEAATLTIDPRGVSRFRTAAEPDVDWIPPRNDHAWHYREWQWWRGHTWGEEMRPRYFGEPDADLSELESGYAHIDWNADGFHGIEQIFFPRTVERDRMAWDVVITIRNGTGADVLEYGQFFACYTLINGRQPHFFWDRQGRLLSWSDRGVEHLNGYVVSAGSWLREAGAIPHCPRGGGKVVGTWRYPVLVSRASPAGWRSIILLEDAHCAALTQGMEGIAMDYILYPGHDSRAFQAGRSFSVHIRQIVLASTDLPEPEDLEKLWADFAAAHNRVHARAAVLRSKAGPG